MLTVKITDRSGQTHWIPSEKDRSLMETIRGAGIDELAALCGGGCSCSTCHVHLAPEWAKLLSIVSADEDDLLDSLEHRQSNSRLACLIFLCERLDGLSATIAPEG